MLSVAYMLPVLRSIAAARPLLVEREELEKEHKNLLKKRDDVHRQQMVICSDIVKKQKQVATLDMGAWKTAVLEEISSLQIQKQELSQSKDGFNAEIEHVEGRMRDICGNLYLLWKTAVIGDTQQQQGPPPVAHGQPPADGPGNQAAAASPDFWQEDNAEAEMYGDDQPGTSGT